MTTNAPRSQLSRAPLPQAPFIMVEQDGSGGFTAWSPIIPELLTCGSTIQELMQNLPEAIESVRMLYENSSKSFPTGLTPAPRTARVSSVPKPSL